MKEHFESPRLDEKPRQEKLGEDAFYRGIPLLSHMSEEWQRGWTKAALLEAELRA